MSEQQDYVPTEEEIAKARKMLDDTREHIFAPKDDVKKWLFAALIHLATAEALELGADLILKINGKALRIELAPDEYDEEEVDHE